MFKIFCLLKLLRIRKISGIPLNTRMYSMQFRLHKIQYLYYLLKLSKPFNFSASSAFRVTILLSRQEDSHWGH